MRGLLQACGYVGRVTLTHAVYHVRRTMGIADDAVEVRAQGWRTLAALHGLIEAALERELQRRPDLSVVEFTVLDALSRQDGWHMRMASWPAPPPSPAAPPPGWSTGSRTAACSPGSSAPTTGAGSTPSSRGRTPLLDRARPTHDRTLEAAMAEAGERPELGRSSTRCTGCPPRPDGVAPRGRRTGLHPHRRTEVVGDDLVGRTATSTTISSPTTHAAGRGHTLSTRGSP